ncbi:MAG TPA: MFS transporter [Symbiobacteriaceae bacterium]|nr:MFS transporter [Symbiobacteriaceae bacterium]
MTALATTAAVSATPLHKNRRFQLVLAGSVISTLGDTFHHLALSIWVLQVTGSATAMSAVATIRILAGILLGAVGGTVADRVDRWRLMWGVDLLRGAIVAMIAWMIAMPATPFWAILTLSALLAVVGQFRGPAFAASLLQIAGQEHVGKARSLLQLTSTGASIVGPLLGGSVVALFGGWAAMTGDSASFFLSALLVVLGGAFASPRAEAKGKKPPFWADLRSGLVYIKQDPYILGIIILAPSLNFFANVMGVAFPVLTLNVWKVSPYEFGIIEAAAPVGMAVTGAVMMAVIDRLRRRGLWMMGATLAFGPIFAALAYAPSVWVATLLVVAMGVGMTITNLILSVSLQAKVAPEVQGRVFGTLGSLTNVASPLSVMLAGPLSDQFGPALVIAVTGVLIFVTAAGLAAGIPAVRKYD